LDNQDVWLSIKNKSVAMRSNMNVKLSDMYRWLQPHPSHSDSIHCTQLGTLLIQYGPHCPL